MRGRIRANDLPIWISQCGARRELLDLWLAARRTKTPEGRQALVSALGRSAQIGSCFRESGGEDGTEGIGIALWVSVPGHDQLDVLSVFWFVCGVLWVPDTA